MIAKLTEFDEVRLNPAYFNFLLKKFHVD